jgi:CDP-diacylglycerol--inositol 3-phosphatidyltransferase
MKSVVFYASNYIGYARVVLSISALHFLRRNPFIAFLCIILSGFVDHFDGDLARAHNQTSKLGAIMDFGCDKMSCNSPYFNLYRKALR